MTLGQHIKKLIMRMLGNERLQSNPNDERLTFISDDDKLKIDEVKANRIWYIGDGNELLNYYTQQSIIGFNNNPIYNRNNRNYFWSKSASECSFKRLHSGIPNAIITTISNIIGMPQIDDGLGIWDKVAEKNDFIRKLTQQARPLTLAEGWGAWKVNINPKLSDLPLWEYYEAEYVEYIYKCGLLIGIIFKSYYKDANNNNYVLLETRYIANGNSYIKYELFKQKTKTDDVESVPLDTLPELSDLQKDGLVIEGLNMILAVPSRYFYDALNSKYGRSIYAGKLDLFDMLDEIWSMASQTNRVSTPVVWYNPDVLERGNNGLIGTPNLYNRQLIQKAGIPDGEGMVNQDIVTDQPDLNFDKYGMLASNVLDYILTGVLSPATLGIDISRKDNALAQREKEKVSILTRNNVIDQETREIKDIVKLSIYMTEYLQKGTITLQDYDISVKYNEFANPSFENQIQILGQAWSNGQISTEKYVDLLWGDKLSDEDKAKELQWLDENKQSQDVDLGGLFGNASANANDLQPTGNEQETLEDAEV